MTFAVCTENPIENFKSYELNSYLILKIIMQKHCPMSSGQEPRFEIHFFGKCYPHMVAINRYIFNCKGDNF